MSTVKKLSYTYVVTGPYGDADGILYLGATDPANEAHGTFDVKRKRAVLIGDGNGKISLTTMRDVGKLVVGALLHPENVHNKAIHVNSFTTTPNQIVAEFERQLGQKWEISYTSLEELKKIEAEKGGSITLRRIWAEGGTLYEKRDNDLIGLENGVDSLESAIKQAIEVQQNA